MARCAGGSDKEITVLGPQVGDLNPSQVKPKDIIIIFSRWVGLEHII